MAVVEEVPNVVTTRDAEARALEDAAEALDARAKAKTRAFKEAARREGARDASDDEDDDGESDESDGSSDDGEFTPGPTVWEAAADEEIPENHWEYHMRKNMNDGRGDSVYRNLAYVPVCNCMPVCRGEACRNPYHMWTKKK